MSDLRNQLDSAKQTYQSAKYPGDLLADLHRPERMNLRSAWRWMIPLTGVAAAAVLALVIFLHPATDSRNVAQNPPADPTRVEQPTVVAVTDENTIAVPPAESLPADVTSAVPSPSFSVPSMPSIPSWSVSTNVSYSTDSADDLSREPV